MSAKVISLNDYKIKKQEQKQKKDLDEDVAEFMKQIQANKFTWNNFKVMLFGEDK